MTTEQTETMSWEDWVKAYRPKPNPLRPFHEGDATSLMHETFGAEYALVEAADQACIWTLVECDNDDPSDVDEDGDIRSGCIVLSGWHFVDRIGYFITEVAFTGELLQVEY